MKIKKGALSLFLALVLILSMAGFAYADNNTTIQVEVITDTNVLFSVPLTVSMTVDATNSSGPQLSVGAGDTYYISNFSHNKQISVTGISVTNLTGTWGIKEFPGNHELDLHFTDTTITPNLPSVTGYIDFPVLAKGTAGASSNFTSIPKQLIAIPAKGTDPVPPTKILPLLGLAGGIAQDYPAMESAVPQFTLSYTIAAIN